MAIGIGIGIPFKKGGGVNWVTYWATLISATVENAQPTHVVLTFPNAQTSLGASDFTIAGFTISSASWAGNVLTLVLSIAVIYGDSLTVTFVRTGGTAVVTNNVLWGTYWQTQTSLLLFFGQTANITGGQLNNEMNGSSDHLDVAGSAGTFTFQAPNNGTYQTADEDYIWFKRSTAQRTTTEAELIGYDFTRTIVYYDSTTLALVAIAILKTGQSVTNKMKNDFKLSIWWSGTISVYGEVKNNRGAYQQGWIIPSILKDGNTKGLYYYHESATITKNGSNQISNIDSFGGLGNSIAQATDAKKPVWSSNGFGGGYNLGLQSGAFTYNPPMTIYLVVKCTAIDNNYRLTNGLADGSPQIMQNSTTNIIAGVPSYYSGAIVPGTANYNIITVVFNNATPVSRLQLNDDAEVTWLLTNGLSMGGITLGARYNITYGANCIYKAAIFRSGEDTSASRIIIKAMLKERFEV